MSNIPVPPEVENITSDSGVECSTEESETRRSICASCDRFSFVDGHTICSDTGCNISLMVSFNFKQCPLEKW